MPARLFAALDDDWQTLCASRSTRRVVAAWRHDPRLGRFSDLEQLLATLRSGRHDPETTDQTLAALARRAPHDEIATRTLLQAILPGLFNVAKRLGHGHVDDDLEAEVLTEAVTRIRTYPIQRRPRAIAANITWDVFGHIRRRHQYAARLNVEPTDVLPVPESNRGTDPSLEVRHLIADAVAAGKLRAADAELLLAIAVGNETMRGRAQREGIAYTAMNERWRRARNRLRLAVAA